MENEEFLAVKLRKCVSEFWEGSKKDESAFREMHNQVHKFFAGVIDEIIKKDTNIDEALDVSLKLIKLNLLQLRRINNLSGDILETMFAMAEKEVLEKMEVYIK